MRLLLRASLRHAQKHPWQIALAALGVMLGVAVVTSIDLTRASAAAAFDTATGAVSGKATHRIEGGPDGLPESAYTALRLASAGTPMAPIVEGRVKPLAGGPSLPVLGVDALAEPAFRGTWLGGGARGDDGPRGDADASPEGEREGTRARLDLATFMTDPRVLIASQAAAARLAVKEGESVELATPAGQRRMRIALIADSDALPGSAATELLVGDIATVQSLLGTEGRLTRIDVIVGPGLRRGDGEGVGAGEGADPSFRRMPESMARLEALLPPGALLVAVESANAASRAMTDAFHTNLQALSLLALLVGMFLVYNALSFTVVQRRGQLGTLRALGVRRGELLTMLLREAALLGAVGTAGGLLLGVVLAQLLLGLVAQTINDLYYSVSITALRAEPLVCLKAIALGVGGSMLAALAPALDAAQGAPRRAGNRGGLERGSRRLAGRAACVGLGVLVLGMVLMRLPGNSLIAGFAGLFALVLGMAMAAPRVALALIEALQRLRWVRRDPVLRIGSRSVGAALSRTGVAIAALMLAVATTVGIGVMVGSFRQAVDEWLSTALQADWYVGAASANRPLTQAQIDRIAAVPGVEEVSHILRVDLPGEEGPTAIAAYGLNDAARSGFRFRGQQPAGDFWERFEQGEAVMVSEPYAFRHHLAPGDELRLRTVEGERPFTIGAVYRDYASDRGIVALSRAAYDRLWPGSSHYSGLGLYTGTDFDAEALRQLLEQGAGEEVVPQPGEASHSGEGRNPQPLAGAVPTLQSGQAIREISLAVFDRTFTITEVLRWLAGAIAFTGVLGALLAIELERAREMGVLKALGFTGRQLHRMVLTETGLMGFVAGLLALPAGIAMAAALVFVINRRAFGWTMPLSVQPSQLLLGLVLAVAASLLAGIFPARRIAATPPAVTLRGE